MDNSDNRDEGGLALVGQAAETSDLARVPEAVKDVLEVEEEALPTTTDVQERSIVARLFRENTDPEEVALDRVPELIADDANFVWVDLSTYNEADLHMVQKLFGVNETVTHTILSPWSRASLTVYPDHFLVSATVARLDPKEYRVQAGQLDIIAGENLLVSAHKQPLPFYERVLARTRHNPELIRGDSLYMLYILFDELLAYYEDLNRHLEAEAEVLEEAALHAESDEFLERLLGFRRYTFALFRLLEEHREVLGAFTRPDFRWVSDEDMKTYFRDLQARLAHLLSLMMGLRETVNGTFQVYATHMANRTNEVIKVLTLVSSVLFSASVIIYLFGTNAATSFRGVASPAGFLIMVAVIAMVAGAILLAFRRKGWV